MSAEPVIPVEAPPPLPLAGPREQLMAKIMFVGACVLALPTAAMTAYSCILIYLVFPVAITGGLTWCGWWLLINYFRRGWDRPMKSPPQRVWIVSLIFNGVGLLALGTWTLNFGTRGSEQFIFLTMLLADAWLLFATVASGLAVMELQDARIRALAGEGTA